MFDTIKRTTKNVATTVAHKAVDAMDIVLAIPAAVQLGVVTFKEVYAELKAEQAATK